MDSQAILARIEARIEELRTSAQAVSLRAGLSADAIRNLKRRIRNGDAAAGMNLTTLGKLASAMDMPLDDLIGPQPAQIARPSAPAPRGMAEDAAPFAPAQGQALDARAALNLLWPGHPQVTHRATNNLPDLGIAPGDFIVCDMAGLVSPGDIAVCTVTDDQTASATTIIRRVVPPWLICGQDLLAIDAPGVQVRWPVVGVIHSPRG